MPRKNSTSDFSGVGAAAFDPRMGRLHSCGSDAAASRPRGDHLPAKSAGFGEVRSAIRRFCGGSGAGPRLSAAAQRKGYQTGCPPADCRKETGCRPNTAPEEPRLDYAFGLVLLKHQQPKLWRTQFENAVQRPGPRQYWPAWQILVRTQIVDRELTWARPTIRRAQHTLLFGRVTLLQVRRSEPDSYNTNLLQSTGWNNSLQSSYHNRLHVPSRSQHGSRIPAGREPLGQPLLEHGQAGYD